MLRLAWVLHICCSFITPAVAAQCSHTFTRNIQRAGSQARNGMVPKVQRRGAQRNDDAARRNVDVHNTRRGLRLLRESCDFDKEDVKQQKSVESTRMLFGIVFVVWRTHGNVLAHMQQAGP